MRKHRGWSRKSLSLALYSFIAACAGCAATPGSIPPGAAGQYARVSILSVTAQSFTRQRATGTIFSNEKEVKDISNWGLDAGYEQQISRELSALGISATFVPDTHLRSEFLRILGFDGLREAPAFPNPKWEAVERPVRDACSTNPADALLLVFPVKLPDYLGVSTEFMPGAGVFGYRARPSGTSVPSNAAMLHLITAVGLFDCRTAKPVAVQTLATAQPGPGNYYPYPLKPVYIQPTLTPLARWTDEQFAEVRRGLANLPLEYWRPAIRTLFGK